MSRAKKVILPILILLVGIAGVALMIFFRRDVEQTEIVEQPPVVRVLAVTKTNHQFRVRSQGTVAAKTAIALISEVEGTVTSISPSLANGGFFRKDDELATLDPRDFELAVTRARARVAAAELQLKIVQAEAEVARTEWRDLGREKRPTDLVLREPQLQEAAAALEGAIADLRKAELDLQRTHIRAPFDGRVREKNVDVGQFVRRGDRVASIFSIDSVEIDLPLQVSDLAYLDLPASERELDSMNGPVVLLKGHYAGREHEWKGNIVRIDGEIDPASRMATLIAEVKDPYGLAEDANRAPLKVGMFVQAEILGRTVENVILIPRVALRNRDNVFTVDAENRLRFTPVEILWAGKETCVIETGLESGDRVCVSPVETPVDGMPVRVSAETEGGGL